MAAPPVLLFIYGSKFKNSSSVCLSVSVFGGRRWLTVYGFARPVDVRFRSTRRLQTQPLALLLRAGSIVSNPDLDMRDVCQCEVGPADTRYFDI